MSQPSNNPKNVIDRFKRILRGETEANERTRVNRRVGLNRPETPRPTLPPTSGSAGASRYKLLPAFWTVASVISTIVNVVLIGILLVLLQVLGKMPFQANDQFAGLLGGLYENFVRMDEAHIRTTIPIRQSVPAQFTLNVTGPTDVVLSRDVTITNALITTAQTGGLSISNAIATIVLPQGTTLPVNIQGLAVPVDQQIPVSFDIAIDIPLNQTELHQPFLGLRQVVEPWYCLVEPNALIDNVQVCSPLSNPAPSEQIIP